MILSILMAVAQPAPMADGVVVELVAGEEGRRCLPDKSLCFDLARQDGDADIASSLIVTAPASGEVAIVSLPYSGDDGRGPSLWSHIVPIPPRNAEEGTGRREFLIGLITAESAMYSGGGGSGGRLHLRRLTAMPGHVALGDEVLNVVWDSSLMIRACFSEQDGQDRLGVCHDEYAFRASLTAAPNDGGELPALTYRSIATAYPQTSRRTEDNSGRKLKPSDLTHWRDTECSYTRVLGFNSATARYEMDRAPPDCSVYTTP